MRSPLPSLSLPLLLAVVPVAVLGVLGGCDGPSARDRDDDDDDDKRLPALRPCEITEDCLEGEQCVDLRCRRACGPDEPCVGSRGVCDEERGVCVQCLVDEECGADEACVLPQGECAPAECSTDVDCAIGESCVGGICVSGLVCTPNELGCVDERTAFVCSGDGAARQEVPCRADQICLDGVCRTQVCTPSTVSCAGTARVTCDATGTETTVETCEGACADGGFGCTCVEGACEARACEPGSARCAGNASQRCSADGTAFEALVDCGQDSCIAGRCLPDACTAGASFCSGRNLLVCQSDGFGYDESTCAETCSGGDGSASCTDQVCQPLAQDCADAVTRRVCNASGTATALVPCGPNETCELGVCVEQACVPQCGGRVCGPDPACGVSCGSCSGTCDANGQCDVAGRTMTVELSWTPSTQDMDLRLSRDPALSPMCGGDVCSFATCQSGDPRPDWDGSGNVSGGDPLLDVTDVASSNPEVIVLGLPTGSGQYRVGAHNFGAAQQGGATAATTAVLRVFLDGVLVASHTRSVPTRNLWDGITLSWSGTSITASDDAGLVADFQCADEGGGDPLFQCVVDGDCPDGQACVFDQLGIIGTCGAVECTSNADCTGGEQCNGNHVCGPGPLLGVGGVCGSDDGLCRVGLHCDFLGQLCQEACNPQVCTAPNTPGCCPVTGADVCTPDGFLGLSGNCG